VVGLMLGLTRAPHDGRPGVAATNSFLQSEETSKISKMWFHERISGSQEGDGIPCEERMSKVAEDKRTQKDEQAFQ
jgi:hypothetical protein